jgi:ribosomal protein S18 acetylase RimI-like enzyme
MTISIETVHEANDELSAAVNRLVSQLSSTAAPLEAATLAAIVESPASTLFVATDNGTIVGTLTLVIVSVPTGVRAWIEDVVVDETARGAGVGEALTLAAVDEARRRHVRSIELTSRPAREAANAMYVKLGFTVRDTNVYRFSVESPGDASQ